MIASFLAFLYMRDQGGECCTFRRTVSLITGTVVVRIVSMLLQSISIRSGSLVVVSSLLSACSWGLLSREERTFFLDFFTLVVSCVLKARWEGAVGSANCLSKMARSRSIYKHAWSDLDP